MKQEEKQLLLKDLCSRLPYNCRVFYEYVDDLNNKTYGYSLTLNTWCIDEFNANKAIIKPYLRPMSSMTEDEKIEIRKLKDSFDFNCYAGGEYSFQMNLAVADWFNSHYFDYRGLIKRGLALEAPEGMYITT